MTTETTASLASIVALERGVWDALAKGDSIADATYLHEEFLGVYATGFSSREQHAAQLNAGPIVHSYEINEARLMVLQEGLVLLAYRADFTRPTSPDTRESMYISSLWRHGASGWLNVFSQDTDVAS